MNFKVIASQYGWLYPSDNIYAVCLCQLKLVNPSSTRLEHLVTQMKWRLQEGQGEAIYQIGVEDSGLLAGLSDAEMKASLRTLQTMADK